MVGPLKINVCYAFRGFLKVDLESFTHHENVSSRIGTSRSWINVLTIWIDDHMVITDMCANKFYQPLWLFDVDIFSNNSNFTLIFLQNPLALSQHLNQTLRRLCWLSNVNVWNGSLLYRPLYHFPSTTKLFPNPKSRLASLPRQIFLASNNSPGRTFNTIANKSDTQKSKQAFMWKLPVVFGQLWHKLLLQKETGNMFSLSIKLCVVRKVFYCIRMCYDIGIYKDKLILQTKKNAFPDI